CFMEKLGWRDRRISPDAGSLFQTFPSSHGIRLSPIGASGDIHGHGSSGLVACAGPFSGTTKTKPAINGGPHAIQL
ncbi:hypothetical protein LU658_28470, partial [Pseudomonas alloputida]|uniref:hypothetical protein n=1 Tax=Pseudomonas alloputida TaxID=1940621 RepID=UPI001E47D26D